MPAPRSFRLPAHVSTRQHTSFAPPAPPLAHTSAARQRAYFERSAYRCERALGVCSNAAWRAQPEPVSAGRPDLFQHAAPFAIPRALKILTTPVACVARPSPGRPKIIIFQRYNLPFRSKNLHFNINLTSVLDFTGLDARTAACAVRNKCPVWIDPLWIDPR